MDAQSLIIYLILLSAIGSAVWNIHVKNSSNTWAFIALMVVPQFILAVPLIILSPLPSMRSMYYILASSVVQTAYIIFLSSAYRHGLVSRIYPLAIGTAPLLSLTFNNLYFGYFMNTYSFYGVLLLSVGIMCFAFVGKTNRDVLTIHGLLYAFVTGVMIFGYSLIDTHGIRTIDNPLSYISWLFAIKALFLFIPMFYLHKQEILDMAGKTRSYLLAGLLAGWGYAVAVWAFSHHATSVVLALRSTSILFVFILSIFYLKEKASFKVFVLSITTTIGIFLILMG